MGNAGDGQFQFFGIGRRREKKASLRDARPGGIGGENNFENWRRGRIGLQLQAQQAQQQFGIAHRHGQGQNFFVTMRSHLPARIFQVESQANGAGGEGTRHQARAQLVKQAAQQKRQRLEFRNGILERHRFFKRNAGFGQQQSSRTASARPCAQAHSLLPEAFGEAGKRQRRKLRTGAHAPAVQELRRLSGEQASAHTGRRPQSLRFLARPESP